MQLPDSHFPPAYKARGGTFTIERFTLTGVHWDKSLSFSIPVGEGCSLPPAWGTKGGEPDVNLTEVIPLLIVLAVLLIAYDLAQKYFIFHLIQKVKDKDEREAIIAILTNRRR
ncbi:MAG: hypothetical protein AB1522_04420 [Chloroflexota bacterium]